MSRNLCMEHITLKNRQYFSEYGLSFTSYAHASIFATLAHVWDNSHPILSTIIFLAKYVFKGNLLLYIVKYISSTSF